jgi:hypothetical protein
MNIKKDWKEQLEGAYSLMLKYSKITVGQTFKINNAFSENQVAKKAN